MGAPVLDVVASLVPLVVLTSFCDSDPHAMCVQRHGLGEVADVERHLLLAEPFWGLDGKVEPLVMASRVGVDSHEQVVLVRFHFESKV